MMYPIVDTIATPAVARMPTGCTGPNARAVAIVPVDTAVPLGRKSGRAMAVIGVKYGRQADTHIHAWYARPATAKYVL